MKLIVAIIRPERLEAVQTALQRVLDEDDNYRMTVDPVQGHGRQHGEIEYFRGQVVLPRMVAKTRITIAVNDKYVEAAVGAIIEGARTENGGDVGDGKIFVTTLEECVRIRTGERGPSAI
ncbi:MAG: P-II family nitrogen regulator [Deltaproteobacteria bacterium]|nr:P-II family nitrogen regulator [Deltaproteobacteria bacterium]